MESLHIVLGVALGASIILTVDSILMAKRLRIVELVLENILQGRSSPPMSDQSPRKEGQDIG